MSEILINPAKLHLELIQASLPAVSVASDGRVDYARALTPSEQTTAEAVIEVHNPAKSTQEARIEAYFAAGITLQAMVFALWQKAMQEDSSAADQIQALMDQINQTIN
jgi:hypothetical protein